MERLNVAVIGCGYWGPNLIRNFEQIPGCNMKMCCDLEEKNLTRMKNLYPNIEATNNFDAIVNDQSIDAVAIATPVYTHFDLAKKCLEHGKHVMIEKPMASSSEQCIELIKLAEKLFVASIFG